MEQFSKTFTTHYFLGRKTWLIFKHPTPGWLAASVLGNKKRFYRIHGTISLWSLAEHLVLTADLFKSMCMCAQCVCLYRCVWKSMCMHAVLKALASLNLPGSLIFYMMLNLVLGVYSAYSRHQRCFAQCSSELLAAGRLGTRRRRLVRVETLKDSSHAWWESKHSHS